MSENTISRNHFIEIHGARLHNLKNIHVEIPRNSFTVITGVSGSGKSTLAFDTLYAEGQRRYVESLSSYARQFLGRLEKPEVDYINGISPAIAIEQKVITRNPRSTVGTSTEIFDYLKVLYARVGKIISPISGDEVKKHNSKDVLDFINSTPEGCKGLIYIPLQNTKNKVNELVAEGYSRARVNNEFIKLNEVENGQHFDLIIDRFTTQKNSDFENQMFDSIQTAFNEGDGNCWIDIFLNNENVTTKQFNNLLELDGITFETPTPELFNFNSPLGACPTCEGFGTTLGISEDLVIPDKNLSVYDGCVAPWKGEIMGQWKKDFTLKAHTNNFPIHTPYRLLNDEFKELLWNGDKNTYGINQFFETLQEQIYKIQNRVLISRYKGKTTCPDCKGNRFKKEALAVQINGAHMGKILNSTIDEALDFFNKIEFNEYERQIGGRLIDEINSRLEYLHNVGVGYISLNRPSNTLSGGESQRINIASSLGSSLVGSLYILDEPSIGLHPADTSKLIKVLKGLNELGNTVIVVEHDEEIMREANYIIDIGPFAGSLGGEVVFAGPAESMMKEGKTLTTDYLLGIRKIEIPKKKNPSKKITLKLAQKNNLKIENLSFPLECLTVVSGVSGSGKSTLVNDVLLAEINSHLAGGQVENLFGNLELVEMAEYVDQNPIGKSSRSNPVTYVKAFDDIRTIFSQQSLSALRGYKPSHFSLNVPNGRCEKCAGEGELTIEMQFMADLKVKCDECKGKRFKDEVLEVEYHGKNIANILQMTIDDAITFFKSTISQLPKANHEKKLLEKLIPLQQVGLGYVQLGQSSSTLSGGEAQRVKLAYFLIKGNTSKKTVFIFDEPTTGLHFHDIDLLLKSFYALVDQGHSVIVIEHNLDVMKCADWIIDLGPEGGKNGGNVLYQGPPEKMKDSVTAKYVLEKIKKDGKV